MLRFRTITIASSAVATALLACAAPAGAADAPDAAAAHPATAHGWHVTKTIAVHNTFLISIGAVASGDAWAGSQSPTRPVIYRLTRGRRQRQASLAGLASASSASNIWALSGAGKAMRYNGSRWRVSKLPSHLAPSGQAVDFRQILALSKSSAWITAWTASNSAGTLGPVILLHWNGRAWTKLSRNLPAGALTGAISSDGHGGLWLGGSTIHGYPRLFHYSRGKWATSKLPPDSLGLPSLVALAQVPGTRSVLGVANLASAFGSDDGTEILKYSP